MLHSYVEYNAAVLNIKILTKDAKPMSKADVYKLACLAATLGYKPSDYDDMRTKIRGKK